MTRAQLIQRFLDLYVDPAYLEIGVDNSVTFNAVQAARKVAVDICFATKPDLERGGDISCHEVESDAYFGSVITAAERFDVVFLDGLHTQEQTLRDFCNAIAFLAPGGVIVIDDVVPTSYHASLPDHQLAVHVREALGVNTEDKSWMGDVYRVVFFIQSFFQQFSYALVRETNAQLVVWREPRSEKSVPRRGLEQIGRLPFESVMLERDAFNAAPLDAIVAAVRAAQSVASQA